jgi:hypothetical protein
MGWLDDTFSTIRTGAESWKALSGDKKAKKLTDALDKVGNVLYGPQGPGASPIEQGVTAPSAPLAAEQNAPKGLPTWALLAAGAGVLFLAVRK